MNPDLMITIVFSLWVLLASGAWGVLVVRSVRNEKTEEAGIKRLDAGPENGVAIRQSGPTRAAGKLPRSSTAARWASRPGRRSKGKAAPRAGVGVGKR
jgi:hypothetical protein